MTVVKEFLRYARCVSCPDTSIHLLVPVAVNAIVKISLPSLFKSRVGLTLLLLIGALSGFQTSFAKESNTNELLSKSDSLSFNSASVDFVKGRASVFPRGDSTVEVAAIRGMPILVKDTITTGEDGFVSLSLNNSSVVYIQPLSKVMVEKIECNSAKSHCDVALHAFYGSVNSNVESGGQNSIQFIINTPYASAAVRGTVFDIQVADEQLLAGVTEGKVNINNELGSVELAENFGTKVKLNESPSSPKPLLQAPVFLPGPSRFDVGGELVWNQMALADHYLFTLNNSVGQVYQVLSRQARKRLPPLNVGRYAINLRAIDEEGFRGQVAARDIDVVKTDSSRIGPVISVIIKENEFSVQVRQQPQIGNQVEFHFSSTEDFTGLNSVDASLDEFLAGDRVNNNVYVRARGVLSSTEVTPYSSTFVIPAIEPVSTSK